MSCLSNLYDVEYGAVASRAPNDTRSTVNMNEEELEAYKNKVFRKSYDLAESPVWPPFENMKNRSWT